MAVLEPYKDDYYLWKYLPSQVASIVFIVLFLAITALHFWRIYKLRTWFCLSFAIGCLCKLLPSINRIQTQDNLSDFLS